MPHQCTSCNRVFSDGSKEMLSGCPDCGGNKFQFRPSSAVEDHSSAPPGKKSPERTASKRGSSSKIADTPDQPTADRSESTTDRDNWTTDRKQPTEDRKEPSGDRRQRTTDGTEQPVEPQEEPLNDGEVVSATEPADPPENRAQADARSGVVSEDELSTLAESTERETAHTSGGRADSRLDTETEAQIGPDQGPQTDPEQGPQTDHEQEPRPDPEDVERPDLSQLREELNSQFESIKIVSQGQYELNLMELYDRQEYIISLQEDGRYVIEMPDAWGPDDDE